MARRLAAAGAALAVAVAAGAGWLAARPAPVATLHLSGDGAGAVRALLPGVPEAATPEEARVEVVLLRRMETLRHVPGLEALCRGRCDGQAVTALLRLVPGRARKTVVVDIGRMGAGRTLDAGAPLAPEVAACVARVLLAELDRLRAVPPPCAGARRQVAVLPWGL